MVSYTKRLLTSKSSNTPHANESASHWCKLNKWPKAGLLECDSVFGGPVDHLPHATSTQAAEKTASSESGSLVLSSLSGERQLRSAIPDSWSLLFDRQLSDWSFGGRIRLLSITLG